MGRQLKSGREKGLTGTKRRRKLGSSLRTGKRQACRGIEGGVGAGVAEEQVGEYRVANGKGVEAEGGDRGGGRGRREVGDCRVANGKGVEAGGLRRGGGLTLNCLEPCETEARLLKAAAMPAWVSSTLKAFGA